MSKGKTTIQRGGRRRGGEGKGRSEPGWELGH